jgi:hypothetical protein
MYLLWFGLIASYYKFCMYERLRSSLAELRERLNGLHEQSTAGRPSVICLLEILLICILIILICILPLNI